MENDFLQCRNRTLGKYKKSGDFLKRHKEEAKQKRFEQVNRVSKTDVFESCNMEELAYSVGGRVVNSEVNRSQDIKKEYNASKMSLCQYAEAIKERAHLISLENSLNIFGGKCYETLTPTQLTMWYRGHVDYDLHEATSLRTVKEVYNYLLTDPNIVKKDVDYSKIDNLSILKNGVFDVKRQKLMRHSAEYFAFSYVDAEYVDDDYCPVFDSFLDTITNKDEVLIERLWYLIAYICMQSSAAKAFFVLGTAPNSGKSVFGKFVQKLFEEQFVSSIALNDMNKEFSLAPLVGAAVNISMDLPSTKLSAAAVSKLKMLTGDDLITINEKYVPQFRYYNRAKLLFATNHPVQILEEDDAFWNRLVYFPFNNTIPEGDQDKRLLEKILKEKNVIVSRALRYGKKFIKNNYVFPTTREIEETISVWKGERNFTVENFLRDCCDVDSSYTGEWTSVLYGAYEKYCERSGRNIVSKEAFRHILEKQPGIKAKKIRRYSTSENPRAGFSGIRLTVGKEYFEGGNEDVINN